VNPDRDWQYKLLPFETLENTRLMEFIINKKNLVLPADDSWNVDSKGKTTTSMPDHNYFANLIWQIADLLRGPYRPPQYERVMLPMTVLRRFDCVLAPTKAKVLA